jgi:hypothetical protein
MLLLPNSQTGEVWGPSKKNALSESREQGIEKYFHFVFKGEPLIS